MSETDFSDVVSRSYHGLATAYKIVAHVIRPDARMVLALMGVVLVTGTLSSLGYLLLRGVHAEIVTQPEQVLAFAALYSFALLAIHMIGKMLRRMK